MYVAGAFIFSAIKRRPTITIIGQAKEARNTIITGPGVATAPLDDMVVPFDVWGDTITKLTFSTYSVKSSYLRILAENFFENAKKVIVCVTEIDYYDYYDLYSYTRMCVRRGVP